MKSALVTAGLVLMLLTGCKSQQPSQTPDPPAVQQQADEFVELTDVGEKPPQRQSWVTSAWVWSDQQEVARAILPDGSVQPDERAVGVRLTVASLRPDKDGAVPLTVEFMNHTRHPMNVLKPFADGYLDDSQGVQLFGPQGPCKYTGPTPSYQLGENAFQRLPYGESSFGRHKLLLENYENTDQSGVYTLYFIYQAQPQHRRRAAELGFENLYSGGWRSGPMMILVGDVELDSVFEESISIWAPEGGYKWSLAELADGIELEWQVRVGRDIEDVVTYSNRGPDVFEGLTAHGEIFGNEQYYGLNDFGHPGPPQYKGEAVKKGVYKGQLGWDGKNWTGPSDFCNPKGAAFPVGTYTLRLTFIGMVDTGQGRRPFAIQRVTPVVVTDSQ